MKRDLRTRWTEGVIVGDGAMGTYLYQLGFPVGISYEELNLLNPQIIEDIHRQYVNAGAELIETNTFSANYERLAKFGLEHKVEQINRAGVRIARQAAGDKAYVVGSVGAIREGKRSNTPLPELRKYFKQQLNAILEEGVDGILLETFFELEELALALRQVRKMTDIPIMCQLTVEDSVRTQDGYALPDAFAILAEAGADMVGLNCRVGPNGIMRALEYVRGKVALPLSVYPDAGVASYIDGEYRYKAKPSYFGQSSVRLAELGARVVGGCCGTTPKHIAAIARALEDYSAPVLDFSNVKVPSPQVSITMEKDILHGWDSIGEEAPPTLVDLVRERPTVIVELDPPRDLDISNFMSGAEALKKAGADAVTMADNSLAVTRMSNMALAHLVQREYGLRALVHITCRDRNMIGSQSHMMGLNALGIDHVLAITGDPSKFGDLPGASSVYDMTSFDMIRMIKQLNEGVAFSGKTLKHRARFVVGSALNPNVKHLDKAVQRLEKKIAAGADYVMTQPVYDPKLIADIRAATSHLNVPVFIGIMPLASGRNAEYLHNEVPGIQLPDHIRGRMSGLEGEQGRQMGVAIAEELIDVALEHFNGIYIMTPFMLYEMSARLTEYVWAKAKQRPNPLFQGK
ncbi:bifunctional homocysteine S-methyltransferase/methylenetetrahydrofolate reductase [Paenibacillus campi]|uniref:bifunctional homocysteine S-methyltransferase/methylenetetrahydrofolate reductase n=1 Tax=Paenibacillus campi TaxID=3106031 RepID=UPI002AFEA801|nr:bifunctional homocysteine S-methyltransferase/methylenetetrahydrofolate reductase [Paenibacillus sp. SGZ-1009]